MDIHGLTKTTLLDYPGHVASTIFTAGCNFRCPFCHNGDLVLHPGIYPVISEEEVLSHLNKRRKVLGGVCITGGEPTLQPDLIPFLEKVKATGLLIKLDTNGYRPDVLKNVLYNGLVNYVAMDIKAGRDNYSKATGIPVDITQVSESVDLLAASGLDHEFRTTCVNGIHTAADFEDIANWLPADSKYFIQSFKAGEAVIDKSCSSFKKSELDAFLELVRSSIPLASLRGIE